MKERIELNEYNFKQYMHNIFENDKYIEYELNHKSGKGRYIYYKIIDGMYLIHGKQKSNGEKPPDGDVYKDIIMTYQILNGETMIELKDLEAVIVKKGDVVRFGGTAVFSKSKNFQGEIEIIGIYCYFNNLIKGLKKMNLEVKEVSDFFVKMKAREEVIVNSDDIKYKEITNEILDFIKKENYYMIKVKALELLNITVVNWKNNIKRSKSKYKRKYIQSIHLIKNEIDQFPERHYSIDSLANSCDMSPTYFKKIFKMCFDDTPYAYIVSRRLIKAKELLIDENFSIQEIANKLRFTSSSKFSTAFKKKCGYTPSEFRKHEQSLSD